MNYEDQWTCRVCKDDKAVPSLARDCERDHGVPSEVLDDPAMMTSLCSGVGTSPEVGTQVSGSRRTGHLSR